MAQWVKHLRKHEDLCSDPQHSYHGLEGLKKEAHIGIASGGGWLMYLAKSISNESTYLYIRQIRNEETFDLNPASASLCMYIPIYMCTQHLTHKVIQNQFVPLLLSCNLSGIGFYLLRSSFHLLRLASNMKDQSLEKTLFSRVTVINSNWKSVSVFSFVWRGQGLISQDFNNNKKIFLVCN